MLEKIGLPARPSLRGNTWVIDASHCQGCSSQFTFINRKHHCRRCGGLFCNSCTQQRMILRGQGDSPVRICGPCKKLEEAARFEMRHGHKSRAGRGSSKSNSKPEDEDLNQILGSDTNNSTVSSIQRATSTASSSGPHEIDARDTGPNNPLGSAMESASPEELRMQALEEKKRYKVLKGEGKSKEALKAFKRGKELERKAEALEIYLRKSRKRSLNSSNLGENSNIDDSKETDIKNKLSSQVSKDKNDLTDELRELGWSDMDLRDEDKKASTMTLEGEFSSLLGEVSQKSSKDKNICGEVVALKKKALMLKREGKMAEAKEELKKAKVLEKQLEEQELLAGAEEESDDELSALMREMKNEKEGISIQYKQDVDFDFERLLGAAENLIVEGNFEVTDEDMEDSEIVSALESLGWTEDSIDTEKSVSQPVSADRESLVSAISSLKREALGQKRAGNIAEAMEKIKKAKLLERDLENLDSQEENFTSLNRATKLVNTVDEIVDTAETVDSKPSKSRLTIQKELLGLKRKALALKREEKLDEAEEVLKKGKVLENQLEQMDNPSKTKGNKKTILVNNHPDVFRNFQDGEEIVEDVTDQDMHDPMYISLLKNLGWNEEDSNELVNPPPLKPDKPTDAVSLQISGSSVRRRNKSEMQRELLGFKRKALALRRKGEIEAAEELLQKAKELEDEMVDLEAPKRESHIEINRVEENIFKSSVETANEENKEADIFENDMQDPALFSVLSNFGWKDEVEPEVSRLTCIKKSENNPIYSVNPFIDESPLKVAAASSQSKSEIQRELLNLKRKALGLRRKGEIREAEDVLIMAKALETQIEEMEAPKQAGFLHANEDDESGTFGSSENNEKQEHVNMVDSLRGGDWRSSHVGTEEKNDLVNRNSEVPNPLIQLESHTNSYEYMESKDDGKFVKPHVKEVNSVEETASPSSQNSARQEILARKKKAITLKREGKITEAREELRQAKLLEKSLEENNPQLQPPSLKDSSSASIPSSDQKEHGSSTIPQKPMSIRDRFKLQQESLNHKRKALKLRREGRIQEAEAESELAKLLESQLEELAAHDRTETTDDVGVEDFLDPQLLSALKAVGLADDRILSRPQELSEPPKQLNVTKNENSNSERIQLEEQIKAEKVKAVNLKRSGKQAEALDALRRAKLFEKKLNSLV